MVKTRTEEKNVSIISAANHQLNKNRILLGVSVAILLLLLAVQAIMSMRQKSVTVDEITYITAGYYHITTGDFLYNTTNPPLIKMISALPLLAVDPALPEIESDPFDWSQIQQWQFARSFLYDNRIDADTLLFLSRLTIVVLSLILGLFIFAWSKELYGPVAALFALFLYSFSPNILAHSRLATQDLGVTVIFFVSAFFFWKFTQQGKGFYLIITGILFGLGILAKTIAVIVLPIFVLYGLILIIGDRVNFADFNLPLVKNISPRRNLLKQLFSLALIIIMIAFIGYIVIHIGYGFQGSFRPIDPKYYEGIIERVPVSSDQQRAILSSLLSLPLPVPLPFARSLFFQMGLASGSGNVYFAGQIYENGLWYLIPAAFLIKTPLPVIILLGFSIIFFITKKRKFVAEWLIILSIIVTASIFILFSNTVVGIRYILPVFPFIFLLISSLLTIRIERQELMIGFLAVISLWYFLAAVRIYPNYLAYFNETVGGPANGYKYLADSNVDWGQDLKALKRYLDERGIDKIKLGYFGSADADYYGINYEYLPSVGLAPQESGQYWWYEIDSVEKTHLTPQTGTIAISANILASPGWMQPLFPESYVWLHEHEPVDQVGYSILIYEIEE